MGIGGLERVVATIARTIDRSLFDPQVLCLRYKGDFGAALEADGVPVHVLPWEEGTTDYLAFRDVARIIRTERIDVIHTHNTDPFISGGLARLLVPKRVVHVHTDHARSFPDATRYHVAEHVLSWFTHAVVGVSEHTTDNLRRYERISPRKLVTIPNGIDPSPYDHPAPRDEIRAELGVAPDVPLMGLAARLTDQKGIDVLLRALPSVLERVPRAHLVVAGDGPEREPLEALAHEVGVADAVSFLGPRTDFVDLITGLDVYALPSRWEGLPMVILEAMAARVAIVAAAVGGVPRAVVDGRSGLLVASEDEAALAAALVRALSEPALRRSLADEARRTFEAEYSADVMTRRYERLYRRLPVDA